MKVQIISLPESSESEIAEINEQIDDMDEDDDVLIFATKSSAKIITLDVFKNELKESGKPYAELIEGTALKTAELRGCPCEEEFVECEGCPEDDSCCQVDSGVEPLNKLNDRLSEIVRKHVSNNIDRYHDLPENGG